MMKKIVRNMSTVESRAFWETAERAAHEIQQWPAWKRSGINVSQSREHECPVCGESPCEGCKPCDRCQQLTYGPQIARWNDEYDGVCLPCWINLSHVD